MRLYPKNYFKWVLRAFIAVLIAFVLLASVSFAITAWSANRQPVVTAPCADNPTKIPYSNGLYCGPYQPNKRLGQ